MVINRTNGMNLKLSNTNFRTLVTYNENFDNSKTIDVKIIELRSITGINFFNILPAEFIEELEAELLNKLNGGF